MKYMLLMYANESAVPEIPEERQAIGPQVFPIASRLPIYFPNGWMR